MELSYRVSFDIADEAFKRLRPKRVLLQLPSGLKRRASGFADELRQRYKCEIVVSGDSCYGACDVPQGNSEFDAIVQLGHAPMRLPKGAIPVIFVPMLIDLDLAKLIPTAIPGLKSPVGIIAIAQHIHQIDEAARILKDLGFQSIIGRGGRRLFSPGHILGCDYSSARSVADRVNSFLLLGGGRFHALGAALATQKPVVVIDPEKDAAIVEMPDTETFLKRRFAVIQAIRSASSLGILISSKLGQKREMLAAEILKKARKHGKKAEIIVMDEITPDKLDDLGFAAYVSTACPRIALDDATRYRRPIGTPAEMLIALEEMQWEDYQIDEWGFSTRRTSRRK